MGSMKQPTAEATAVRYEAAGGDHESTMGGQHREEVPYRLKAPVAVRKPRSVRVPKPAAAAIAGVAASRSRPGKLPTVKTLP